MCQHSKIAIGQHSAYLNAILFFCPGVWQKKFKRFLKKTLGYTLKKKIEPCHSKMVSLSRVFLAVYVFACVQLAAMAEPWKEAKDPKSGKVLPFIAHMLFFFVLIG